MNWRGLTPIAFALLAACGTTQRGGYYQNDGPPDRAPGDVASTPDAVPRIEPFLARANRPYGALGRGYTPLTTDVEFRERGLASWYGRRWQGRPTASGERYDRHQLTAAHRTAPLGTQAVVTNLANGYTVRVRINDRGPHKRHRILDLSYEAARRLGLTAA